MSVKLGIAPIAWSNDDMPELGGDTSLEQCLSEASQAGFIGIESGGKFPKKSEELIPKLNEFNLNLCSGWYGANLRTNSVNEEKNYSGWLVVEAEQDPAKANPFEYAKIGYKYLTETLKKSSLEVFQN